MSRQGHEVGVVQCVVRGYNETVVMNFLNRQGSNTQSSSSDEDSEEDLMSEMFGMSCNMTVEDAESDEEVACSDSPSKSITESQATSGRVRLHDLIGHKKVGDTKEKAQFGETYIEQKKVVSKVKIVQNNERTDSPVHKASESVEAKHIDKTATAKSQGTTFGVIDTVFPADSVEFCHVDSFQHVCAVSTYKYSERKKDRCGDVQFYSLEKSLSTAATTTNARTNEQTANSIHTPSFPQAKFLKKVNYLSGVLDAKWTEIFECTKSLRKISDIDDGFSDHCDENRNGNGYPVLAVATSGGYVSLLEPKLPSECTKTFDVMELYRLQAVQEGNIVLSIDWGTRGNQSSRNNLLTTHSDGTVAIWNLENLKNNKEIGEPLLKWRAHDLYGCDTEVWIGIFDHWHNDQVIYTGADDGKLKCWDIRAAPTPVFAIQPTNNSAGVCSGQSAKFHEYVLATGGYDGIVRVWDTRMVGGFRQALVPLAEYDVGGGVWRLKWNPNPKLKDKLVAASMRGGVHVLSYKFSSNGSQESESISTRKPCLEPAVHYSEHPSESLAYGADWCYDQDLLATGNTKGVLGTCSFYNHELRFWHD